MLSPVATPAGVRRDGWGVLGRMARRHRVLLGASLVSALAWQGVVLLMPIVLGWMVQHGIEDGERRAIWIGGGAIVALGIAEALCDALRHRTENAGAAQVAASLREEVVTAALTLDDRARASMPPGEVIARVTSDADAISDLFDSIGYTVAYILMVPTVLGILAYIDVMLASAVLGTSAAGAIAFWWASRAWEQRSALAQEAVGMMVTRAQETISGFKTLRGLGAEEATLARFDRASVAARDTSLSAANLWIAFEPFMDALSVLPVVIVLGAAGTQVADGELGVGTAITAIGLAVFLVTPVRVLGSAVIGLQQGLASARRVDDVLRGRIADSRPGRVGATHPPSIELRGAVCAHPGWPRMPMFAAIDLRLDPGDVLLIRGPVGAGKSLLLRAIAGREPLLDGEVRLGGVSLEHLARDEVRRRVLLLEQSPFIFEGTLADNLRIAGSADAATMLAAAAVADVSEFAGAGAAGLDTEAGERGVRLSGGQRQRLALARAVIARPEVLLLDGATSALEPAREIAALRRVIEHWRHGVIILVSPNPLAEPLATATLDLSPVPIEARR